MTHRMHVRNGRHVFRPIARADTGQQLTIRQAADLTMANEDLIAKRVQAARAAGNAEIQINGRRFLIQPPTKDNHESTK